MRRDARVDTNQPDIVDALRAVGATVQHLHMVGGGCPDLLVGFRMQNYLLEVKTERGSMNQQQWDWATTWRGGGVHIVRSVEDALGVILGKEPV